MALPFSCTFIIVTIGIFQISIAIFIVLNYYMM